jgi:hypothetical protein
VARLLVGAFSTMRPEDRIGADLDAAVARYQWLVRHRSIVRFAEPQRRLVATKRSVLMQREREDLRMQRRENAAARRYIARGDADGLGSALPQLVCIVIRFTGPQQTALFIDQMSDQR